MAVTATVSDEVKSAFSQFDAPQRAALTTSWLTAVKQVPGADQCIAWAMPSLRIDGDLVLSMLGFAEHNSVFPGPGVIERLESRLADSVVTKGTIHFDRDRAMSASLMKDIIGARIEEINASYPRSNGQFKEFYPNGFLKAKGKMRGSELHGSWEWFRRDGTLKRTGRFKDGQQVGTWITYDADGKPYKETTFH